MALELGVFVADLRRRMTEREFRFWSAYRRRKSLPSRRNEIYLAQIALMIARTMGGATAATIDEFLMKEVRKMKQTSVSEGASIFGELASGSGVVRLGQKRKKHG